MYYFDEMIDLGLKENQKFPTEAHKTVAQTIALRNPQVTNKGLLTEIVQSVLSVPESRIKKITLEQLFDEFNCPKVL